MLFWEVSVPWGYRNTELSKLPFPKMAKSLWTLDFDIESPYNGAFIFGGTGAGKTRTCYLFARHYLEHLGGSVMVLRGGQFQREVINRTRPGGSGDLEDWLWTLSETELLVLDEFEKLKFTERVESEFFDLIEDRTSNRKTLILVANAGLAKICARMSDDIGPAVERRVLETLVGIKFSAAEEAKCKEAE